RLARAPLPAHDDVGLGELVAECVGDAAVEAAGARKTVQLRVSKDLRVRGDPAMLRSAIENVLRNAVRFAPERSRIDVEVKQDGHLAAVSVADSGPGVADDDLGRIFEPFFRAGATDGTGLGLAIAERIMTIHGGTISARNRADRGLEVVLSLPLHEPVARAMAPVQSAPGKHRELRISRKPSACIALGTEFLFATLSSAAAFRFQQHHYLTGSR